METDDVFSDQMQVCRPVFVEQLGRIAICIITDLGNIVGQSVQPYIDNMLRIKVYRDTPAEGCSGYA